MSFESTVEGRVGSPRCGETEEDCSTRRDRRQRMWSGVRWLVGGGRLAAPSPGTKPPLWALGASHFELKVPSSR